MAPGVYRAAERRFQSWKNGGGETAEIVVSPAGADFETFEWRISTAKVARSGPFSVFPGVDRTLAVLEGGAIRLEFGNEIHLLDPDSPPIAFSGALPCMADLDGDPLLDLNVMVRRPLRAELTRIRLDSQALETHGSDQAFVLLLEGKAGLSRMDLVDLRTAPNSTVLALRGAEAYRIRIGLT
jgi:environmental stress-induced protein Ves